MPRNAASPKLGAMVDSIRSDTAHGFAKGLKLSDPPFGVRVKLSDPMVHHFSTTLASPVARSGDAYSCLPDGQTKISGSFQGKMTQTTISTPEIEDAAELDLHEIWACI